MSDPAEQRGPIAWMARNSVAANLLMIVTFAGGFMGLVSIKQEVFPEFDLDAINVTVPYPGASPGEVEQGIVLAVEEAVRGLDGIKRVTSVAAEGAGNVRIDLLLGAQPEKVLSDVKNEIDRIQTFPEEAEEPTIAIATRRREVISLVLAGDQAERTLHDLAERARADLLAHPDITQVEIGGVRPLEVSVEVPRETLEAYGLTLEEVAQQIRAASVELPGGGLDTKQGELLVRLSDRRRTGAEFEDVVIKSTATGFTVRLSEIARIEDGYADTDQASYYDGRPAVRVTAYRVGAETPTDVAAAVRTYAEKLESELPDNVTVAIWADDSELLKARIDLLMRNARLGLVLVLLVLAAFLRARLAAWVALGIPISFFAALAVLPAMNVSINMVTTFAFIITLGLVVDDAIVVGENISTKLEEGMAPLAASIAGAREMAVPVTFSVLTTMAAFSPLLFVPGTMGKIFSFIPIVVLAVLFASLLESFFVLPSHLGHTKQGGPGNNPLLRPLAAMQRATNVLLEAFSARVFLPVVGVVTEFRYIATAGAIASFLITVGVVASGLVPFSFFPKLEADQVVATAQLPYGAPLEQTQAVRRVLERSASEAIEELGGRASLVRGMFTKVGEGPKQRGPSAGPSASGSHLVTVELNLVPSAERSVSSAAVAAAWTKRTPEIPGITSLQFIHAGGPSAGADVAVQLAHTDTEVLAVASEEMATMLRGYDDLTNIENQWSAGKPQIDYHLRPEAQSLGLTGVAVARQLRSAFFGAEALREQRGRNEIKVMVRLPEAQRRSEADLERLLLATPAGGHVPLETVVNLERGRAPTSIDREDGRRVVTVSGELKPGVPSPQRVLGALEAGELDGLIERHPGLTASLVGAQREQAETIASLRKSAVLALFVMFGLLAVPFKSYSQPLIVMSVIPFGFVGAVAGHMLMGYGLSMISLLGIVALSGVVVNDSLVLIDATNKARARGMSAAEAVVWGARRRLRPILLTSLTTFFGLAPMILETSMQARFLIPMAISLGFGVLFATFIVLLLVPAFYLVLEDVLALLARSPDAESGFELAPDEAT